MLLILFILMFLNEYLPLKQGLRQRNTRRRRVSPPLNEYLPLKQGLRLALKRVRLFQKADSMSIFH